jgi:hypothetical protein
LLKLRDSPASLSRFGVLTFGSPVYPKADALHWSVRINTTFGLAGSLQPVMNIPARMGSMNRKTTLFIGQMGFHHFITAHSSGRS